MSSEPIAWKRPDEVLKLQRLKQKQKALQARIKRPSNPTSGSQADSKDAQATSSQTAKRRNPFAR